MAGNTSIEWATKSWNPIRGCSVYSAGCTNCYAMRQAHWRGGSTERGAFAGLTKSSKGGGVWTGKITLVEKDLETPLRWRKPERVFVNSMSDMFHVDVPDDFIRRLFDVMGRAHQHVFQLLTKRAERMLELSDRLPWHPNIWAGVSVEDEKSAYRAELLAKTGARIKWISAEPLLAPIPFLPLDAIDWVVLGGESGPGARRCDPEWIRNLLGQCRASGVRPFTKQLGTVWATENRARTEDGSRDYKGKHPENWPEDLRVREYPEAKPRALPEQWLGY